MSLSVLWEHVRKIWEKGRGYRLEEILDETEDYKKAIFVNPKTGKRAYVHVTKKQVTVASFKKIVSDAEELGCQELTIATLEKVTPQAEQMARQKQKSGEFEFVEIIDKKAPLVYIFDHWMVPEHRVLSREEARKIIEKYAGGDPTLLPKILATDPAVRILRAKPGDVIEIIRRVPSLEELREKYGDDAEKIYNMLRTLTPAGEERTYRLVIEKPEEYLY